MPADIRLVRYTGEYGATEGFLRKETPKPKEHNFHVRYEGGGQVPAHWGFASRPTYRLLELPITVVNIGDQPMEIGPMESNREHYRPIVDQSSWAMCVRNFFSYSWDAGEPSFFLAVLLWNAFEVISGHEFTPSNRTDIKLSAGWAAIVPEYRYAPLDITDVPDGDHMLSIKAELPGSFSHVLDFNINLNKTDLHVSP